MKVFLHVIFTCPPSSLSLGKMFSSDRKLLRKQELLLSGGYIVKQWKSVVATDLINS